MNAATIFGFVFSGGLGAVVLKLLDLFFSRGARQADPAKTLIEANSQFTKEMREDYARVSDENKVLHTEMDQLRRTINRHATWDRLVVDRLAKEGIHDLPEPPDLYSEGPHRSENDGG